MKTLFCCCLLFWANVLVAADLRVLLPHTWAIESQRGKLLVGDDGRSLGHYHFQRRTWDDVTRLRRKQGLPTAEWRTGAMQLPMSSAYALTYYDWLHEQLTIRLGYSTLQHIDAAWVAGINRVCRLKGNLNLLDSKVRNRVALLSPARL